MLRIDYCGLGQFHGVQVFCLYKFHCLIYSLLLYTTKIQITKLHHDITISIVIMTNGLLVKIDREIEK